MVKQIIPVLLFALLSSSNGAPIAAPHSDVQVLMKISKSIHGESDLEAISHLKETYAVMKIKEMVVIEGTAVEGWNFAVLGRGLKSEKQREAYVAKIKSFKSVEKVHVIVVTPFSSDEVKKMNTVLKIAKMIGKALGFLPKRPLKPQTPPVIKCDVIDVPEGLDLVVLSFNKAKDFGAAKKLGELYHYKVLPALDVRYEYSGIPSGGYWNNAQAQNWQDKKTLCEWMESEMIVKMGPLFQRAIEDVKAFTGFIIGGPEGLTRKPFE